MNDLEVQKENEIIEVQTPIIEQSPIIEYKPNYFLFFISKITPNYAYFISCFSAIYSIFWELLMTKKPKSSRLGFV